MDTSKTRANRRPRKRFLLAGGTSALAIAALVAPAIGSATQAQAADAAPRYFSVAAEQTQGLPGQYQVAQAADGYIWVTGSSGRPPIETATIAKVDPATMKIVASAQLQTTAAKDRKTGEQLGFQIVGPYGIDTDDVNGTVWVTNTRTNSVSVYSQANMELLYTSLDENADTQVLSHPREVLVDPSKGYAYVGSNAYITVFDLKTYQVVKKIESPTDNAGRQSKMNMALDESSGRLFVPDLAGNVLEVINTNSLEVVDKFPLTIPVATASLSASDVAYDASLNELYVSSQGSDGSNSGVGVYDGTTGAFKTFIDFGSRAVGLDNDEARDLVYVTDFGTGQVGIIDGATDTIVGLANTGERGANDVEVLQDGSAFVVNKATYAENVEVPFTLDFNTGEYRTASTEQKGKDAELTPISANAFTKIRAAETTAPAPVPNPDAEQVKAETADGATVSTAKVLADGSTLEITGTGWKHPSQGGSIISVKADRGSLSYQNESVIASVDADADGNWTLTLPFPSEANGYNTTWAEGSSHTLHFLSGSAKEGDVVRSPVLNITVGPAQAPVITAADPVQLPFAGYGEVIDVKNPPVVPEPTPEPTVAPTSEPTAEPTAEPTVEPTVAPTAEPTAESTVAPTVEPTAEPTVEPTVAPSAEPSPSASSGKKLAYTGASVALVAGAGALAVLGGLVILARRRKQA